MELSPGKIPKSALHFYVALYCKKKDTASSKYQNNVVEATKSWLSLTDSEKQQFVDRVNVYKLKHRNIVAEYLRKSKPYLKRKLPKRISNQNTELKASNNDQQKKSVDTTYTHDSMNEFEDTITKTETEYTKSSWSNLPPENTDFIKEIDRPDSSQSTTTPSLPEPPPPKIVTGKDLFNIIKLMDEESNNDKTYKTLTVAEKRRYQQAVLVLKKDYIVKLKAFLESLNSRDLYHYYNKNI